MNHSKKLKENDVVVVRKNSAFYEEGEIGIVKGTGECWGYDYEIQIDTEYIEAFDSEEIKKIGEL